MQHRGGILEISFEAATNMSFKQGAQYVLPQGRHALIGLLSLEKTPGSQHIMHVTSGSGGGGGGSDAMTTAGGGGGGGKQTAGGEG